MQSSKITAKRLIFSKRLDSWFKKGSLDCCPYKSYPSVKMLLVDAVPMIAEQYQGMYLYSIANMLCYYSRSKASPLLML